LRIHDVRVASRALIALWGLLLLGFVFGIVTTSGTRDRTLTDNPAGTTAESAHTPPQAGVPAPEHHHSHDDLVPAEELEPGLARLEIPRLGIAVLVVQGGDPTQPPAPVATPIAPALQGAEARKSHGSHSDTFFRFLSAVVPGDTIVVSTRTSVDHYLVDWAQPVHPDEMDLGSDGTPDPTLTIVTGYPFDDPAPSDRFMVRAHPIDVNDMRRADAGSVVQHL
jgi:LPXTG-site transpeptidase (sortase) family protein